MTEPRKQSRAAQIIPINKAAIKAAVKPDAPAPATRPLLDGASAFLLDIRTRHKDAKGEVDLIEQTEARDEAAFLAEIARLDEDHVTKTLKIAEEHRNAVDSVTLRRNAEREGRARLRAEQAEIVARCEAALSVGLADGAEGQ
jgi:hypothetical protein